MKYPNLEAIAQGAIAGNFREWPQVRPEAQALLAERSTLLSALRTARDALLTVSDFNQPSADFWNRGGQGYQAYDAVNDVLKGTEE
jgi:hypothetical protein